MPTLLNMRPSSSDPRSSAGKPLDKTILLGQVFTPSPIARQMVKDLFRDRPHSGLRILDPAVGPSTFPRAMALSGLLQLRDTITAVDIDGAMISQVRAETPSFGANLRLITGDYLKTTFPEKFDCAILNPPYIRQEWIDNKHEYRRLFKDNLGIAIPGTSNLYVYFIVKVLNDLSPGGTFSCIVYDSWQSTLFGRWLLATLKTNCSVLSYHPLRGQPFEGRLIDATIIRGKKKPTSSVLIPCPKTFHSQQTTPFSTIPGFVPISSVLSTRRGLRLKQADFFLCNPSLEHSGATPFLKKVAHVVGYAVPKNHPEAALLVTPSEKPPLVIKELKRRLALAKKDPRNNISILTWYTERPGRWFFHSEPPYAPIVLNYYLRSRPRHIYNPNRKYSDNFYGLTPKGCVSPIAWLAILNSTAACIELLAHARNQGAGLAKLQLYEYRGAFVPDLNRFTKGDCAKLAQLGQRLLAESDSQAVIEEIDLLLATVTGAPELRLTNVSRLFKVFDTTARNPRGSAQGSEVPFHGLA
jgi:adenine-specific DNA-methyltransferase